MVTRFDRRLFLLGSAGTLMRPARRRPEPGPVLVLVQLSGGNDGLSMVVPYSDDGYARARTVLRIPAERVLRIDERIGFAPSLPGVNALYQAGELALCEGVGHPHKNRSHFKSMDIWHVAGPLRDTRPGWIGRCIERSGETSPFAVVHLGFRPPYSLASDRHPPLTVAPGLLMAGDAGRSPGLQLARELEAPAPEEGATLVALRARWHHAQEMLLDVRAALERRTPAVVYPPTAFAQDCRSAAALIHSDLGVRVVSLELGGFDTHRDQPIRHERLMQELDGGLASLIADLARSEGGREALVLVFSEFGRRVVENASMGTDHGAAGPVLVLGSKVRGGLYGRPPSLTELQDGDLVFTTDFRSVYAGCIEHVFGLAADEVLDARYPALGFV